MNKYQDFSSLPAAEEQEFVVYEQQTIESGRKAMILGLAVAMVLLVVTIGVVFSHDRPEKGHQMAGDDLGSLVKPDQQTGANAPAVSPVENAAEAPQKPDAPAEAVPTETTP